MRQRESQKPKPFRQNHRIHIPKPRRSNSAKLLRLSFFSHRHFKQSHSPLSPLHLHNQYQHRHSSHPPKTMETNPPLLNNPPLAAGRRDEWSEGAVACLLGAYESKWERRGRAKLRSRDWDELARRVSGRAGGLRSAKTPSQCKNKVESLKKRYRSESAAVVAGGGGGGLSRWPFFGRIQALVVSSKNDSGGVLVLEGSPAAAEAVRVGGAPATDGGLGGGKEPLEGKGENKEHSQTQMNVEHNKPTNAIYKDREDKGKKKKKKKRKIQESEEGYDFEVFESIRSLAETTLKVEQLRMKIMRDVEKIWAQAEAKKGDFDLKRTELTAKTQLKIARLFYKSTS